MNICHFWCDFLSHNIKDFIALNYLHPPVGHVLSVTIPILIDGSRDWQTTNQLRQPIQPIQWHLFDKVLFWHEYTLWSCAILHLSKLPHFLWIGMSQIRKIEPNLTNEKPESQRFKVKPKSLRLRSNSKLLCFRNHEGIMIPTQGFLF